MKLHRSGPLAASLLPLLVLGPLACSKPPADPDDKGGISPARTGGASGGGATGGATGDPGSGGHSGSTSGGSSGSASGGSSGSSGGTGAGGSGTGAGGSGGGASDGPPSGAGGAQGGQGGQGGAPSSTLPPGVKGHPNPTFDYPKYPGFTLALVEEFEAPIDLDNDPVWTWSDGGLPEGAVRFVKDAITFAGGKMVITVRRQNAPGSNSFAEPVADNPQGFVPAKPLRSGEFRTKYNNYRYGRYEARLKPPTSNGNFISTLFLFRTPKFVSWRELDIELTADRPAGVVTNLIYANNVGAWNPDIQEFGDMFPAGPGSRALPGGFANQGQFHTYAIEWLPNKVTWFVDDVPVRVKMGGRLGIPEKSAKIMMNLWIFAVAGGFGGDPTRNAYPMSSEYEWFRFYKWDQDDRYPCADLPNCLPAEDRNKSKNNPDDGVAP